LVRSRPRKADLKVGRYGCAAAGPRGPTEHRGRPRGRPLRWM